MNKAKLHYYAFAFYYRGSLRGGVVASVVGFDLTTKAGYWKVADYITDILCQLGDEAGFVRWIHAYETHALAMAGAHSVSSQPIFVIADVLRSDGAIEPEEGVSEGGEHPWLAKAAPEVDRWEEWRRKRLG